MSDETSESMVERIKRRSSSSRATVPDRTTSFLDITEGNTSPPLASPSPPTALPKPSESDGLLETAARRQIRLIVDLDSQIDDFCKRHKITMETYLEALHVTCRDDTAILGKVIPEAKKRLLERKKAGRIRRLQTQMKQDI